MTIYKKLGLMIVALVLLSGGCVAQPPAVDTASERATIEQVIKNSIDWALNKDQALLYRVLANDSTLFIFHPDNASTIIGFDAFKTMTEQVFMNPAFKAISSQVKNLRIDLSKSGDVAWWSAFLDDRGEWNGQPSVWENVRWTGVLEKRNGKWVIMQMHFSHSVEDMQAAIQKAVENAKP